MITRPFLLTMMLSAWSFSLQGCTAIGYCIGKGVDNKNSTNDTIQVTAPSQLTVGSGIELATKQGNSYSGLLTTIKTAAPNEPDNLRLSIASENYSVVVPWQAVKQARQVVVTKSPDTGRVVGLCLGLVLDVTAGVVISHELTKDIFKSHERGN